MRYALPPGSAYQLLPTTAAEIRRFSYAQKHKTQFFIAAKRQKVRKNIWHFLLRQSVYFKRS